MAVPRAGTPQPICLCYNPNAQQFTAYAGKFFLYNQLFFELPERFDHFRCVLPNLAAMTGRQRCQQLASRRGQLYAYVSPIRGAPFFGHQFSRSKFIGQTDRRVMFDLNAFT